MLSKTNIKRTTNVPKLCRRQILVTLTSNGNTIKIAEPTTKTLFLFQMASLPLSRNYSYTSTDSDDSDADSAMLASCSLQEIRQEDLAAILPDQQDCDAFGGFESRTDKNSTQTGDASGSDMELPQQAVNALIQRTTESSSESESHAPPNPNSLYANSLLQQFVAQTQLLNAPSAAPPAGADGPREQPEQADGASKDVAKRKRGRPRKTKAHRKATVSDSKPPIVSKQGDFCGNPNVSPDSGIQNSPEHVSSPEPNPKPTRENDLKKPSIKTNPSPTKNSSKPTNTAIKPPNSALNSPKPSNTTPKPNSAKTALNSSESPTKHKEQQQQSKLPVTSNRFDRLLYANADRVLYPPRRKAGRPPINRKGPGRPPKHRQHAPAIVEVAETALKPANRSTGEKIAAKSSKTKKSHGSKEVAPQITSNTEAKVNGIKEITSKKTKSKLLFEICERVSMRLELNNKYTQKSQDNAKNTSAIANNKPVTFKTRKSRVLECKNKLGNVKNQAITLKNVKLMHSKHKHKKHKKCKFKILKPVTAAVIDPKINVEIEKLIADFVKFCYISSTKSAKENIPEMIKALKKVSKKRKTSEYNERKKKKQSVNNTLSKETNSNEQRLPLKKRHYHLTTNETKPETETPPTAKEAIVETKPEKAKTSITKTSNASAKTESVKPSSTSAVPKYIPVIKSPNNSTPKVTTINNNEYEVANSKSQVGSHIDEAIEACITRYSGEGEELKKTPKKEETTPKEEKEKVPISSNLTATTPKKRHRLEINNAAKEVQIKSEKASTNTISDKIEVQKARSKTSLESVVNELKLKKNLTHKATDVGQKKADKKLDTIAQIITRKKNLSEEPSSNTTSKPAAVSNTEITESQKRKKEASKEEANRDSVIKYPVCKKAKPAETEKLEYIDAKPTGIFMPTCDLEMLIPSSAIVAPKSEEITPLKSEKTEAETDKKSPATTEKHEIVKKQKTPPTPEALKKKIRKRRAINRTGFPTVKKKKKKIFTAETSIGEPETSQKKNECDRVPKEGEEYSKFLQRTESTIVTIEKPEMASDLDSVSKWEVLSECDSLPQEERTEIEADDIRIEIKTDRMSLRPRDLSPATSVDTTSSKTKIKEENLEDLDDLPLELRIKLKDKTERNKKRKETKKGTKCSDEVVSCHSVYKRKFRDVSPASSVEQFIEKRLREERASASSDELKRNRKAPRWRKKYLVAGLFSDYYKEDE